MEFDPGANPIELDTPDAKAIIKGAFLFAEDGKDKQVY